MHALMGWLSWHRLDARLSKEKAILIFKLKPVYYLNHDIPKASKHCCNHYLFPSLAYYISPIQSLKLPDYADDEQNHAQMTR